MYEKLKINEARNLKIKNQKQQHKNLKKEIQENFESTKWNQQWEKAKQMQSKDELHEVFIEKITSFKAAKIEELESEKIEQERTRNEEINSKLKSEYRRLLKEKEMIQKSLNLYK